MLDKFEEYWKDETILSPEYRSGGAAKDIARDAFAKGYKAAQQKMHQTTFGVGMPCLIIGYVAGWLIFAFNFGGW